MIRYPNCKINLGLSVLEKLPDGYHRIETCFYPVGLCDILEINLTPSSETHLGVSGIEINGNPENNLCYKAWKLLSTDFGIPVVDMHLHKIIPTGSGLGGGSSDAAFTLLMLNELFSIGLTFNMLSNYAARLGMDCPYFLFGSPAMGSGKGEILSPVSQFLIGLHIVIIHPGIVISTAEAYSGIKPTPLKTSISNILLQPVEHWKNLLINDFEASIFSKYPVIAQIKENMYRKGAIYASMSGSGSSVYGIFRDKPDFSDSIEGYNVWQGIL